MGYNPYSKFPQITHLKYKPPHTYKMNPATVFSAVVAVLSVGSANAIFGADVVTATGASSGLGTSVILASGAGVPTAAAAIGAGLLLKAGALFVLNQAGRSKRSADDAQDALFTTIAASEPAACVKQLICDIATGAHPSENDIILSLFESETPVTSPKFDFAVAATLGKQLKSVEACELRYTCPVKL